MKLKPNDIVRAALYLLVLLLVVVTVLFYKSVFWMILGAVIFSYLLKPAVDYMEIKGIVRWLAIIIVYTIIAGLLAIAIISIVPAFVEQLQEMGSKITNIVTSNTSIEEFEITELESVQKLLKPVIEFSDKFDFIDLNSIFRDFLIYLQKGITELPRRISQVAGKVINLFTFLIMMPTLGFFLLNDRELFKRFFFQLVPNRYFELMLLITEKTDNVLKIFFRATMFEMLIVAVMSTLAMIIVGVPYSIVVGLFAGVGNVIPYLGPLVGIVAAVISILLSGAPLMKIVSAIIALQIVQFIENRFIYPAVMGRSMDMHPMVVLLTVLAGGYTMGVFGMLLSVPVVFLIKEIVIILRDNLRKFEIIR